MTMSSTDWLGADLTIASSTNPASPEIDGVINLDSEIGRQIGFTSDRFAGYLWKQGDRILISLIISRAQGQGHLSRLFEAIEKAGYRIAVPCPMRQMREILTAKGFAPHKELSDLTSEMVDVWERSA